MEAHGFSIDVSIIQESLLAVRRLYSIKTPHSDVLMRYSDRVRRALPMFYSRCVYISSEDALKLLVSDSLYMFMTDAIAHKARGLPVSG